MKALITNQAINIALALLGHAAIDELIQNRVQLSFRKRPAFQQYFQNCKNLFITQHVS